MKQPVCLFIKLDAPSFSSLGMIDGMEKNGYSVVDVNWQTYRFNNGIPALRTYLIQLAADLRPDLIFLHIQSPDIIDAETAKKLSLCGTTVNFSEDVRDPLPDWYVEVGKEISLTLFTNREDVEELTRRGVNARYIQTSYNHIWYKKQPKSKEYTGDIVFVGNNYVNTNLNFPLAYERYGLVKWLEGKYGPQFKVHGMNWDSSVRSINPQRAIEVINNAKVVVTHSNFNRRGYTSDRLFNTVGCGAYPAVKYYEGVYFDFPGLHIPVWNDFDELEDIIQIGLDSNNDVLKDRIGKIHQHVLHNHTWIQRSAQIKEMLNECI